MKARIAAERGCRRRWWRRRLRRFDRDQRRAPWVRGPVPFGPTGASRHNLLERVNRREVVPATAEDKGRPAPVTRRRSVAGRRFAAKACRLGWLSCCATGAWFAYLPFPSGSPGRARLMAPGIRGCARCQPAARRRPLQPPWGLVAILRPYPSWPIRCSEANQTPEAHRPGLPRSPDFIFPRIPIHRRRDRSTLTRSGTGQCGSNAFSKAAVEGYLATRSPCQAKRCGGPRSGEKRTDAVCRSVLAGARFASRCRRSIRPSRSPRHAAAHRSCAAAHFDPRLPGGASWKPWPIRYSTFPIVPGHWRICRPSC